MGRLTEAVKVSELGDNEKKKVVLEGQEILIARVGNEYYAVGNRCPHMNGDLSKGILEGTIITCPRHSSQFDLKDGSVVRWLKGQGVMSKIGGALKSSRPLKTYKITVEGDAVLVEI